MAALEERAEELSAEHAVQVRVAGLDVVLR